MNVTYRRSHGIVIEGQRYGVGLYISDAPMDALAGEIAVTITRLPTSSEDRRTKLEPETPYSFKPEDIKVEGNTLSCMATLGDDIPEFRTGFVLQLEEGMASLINERLPAIAHASTLYFFLMKKYQDVQNDQPWPHRRQYIREAAAAAILDGVDFYGYLNMLLENAPDDAMFKDIMSGEPYEPIVDEYVSIWKGKLSLDDGSLITSQAEDGMTLVLGTARAGKGLT